MANKYSSKLFAARYIPNRSDYDTSVGENSAEELLKESRERLRSQPTSIIANMDFSEMYQTDIPHISNLLQQDDLHRARSYVSNVKFEKNYEDDKLLTDIGSITIATVRTGYARQTKDMFYRQVSPRRYVDTTGLSLYEKKHSKNSPPNHRHSSVNTRKHKIRHRVQASSTLRKIKNLDQEYCYGNIEMFQNHRIQWISSSKQPVSKSRKIIVQNFEEYSWSSIS
ncbi:unnamed protein product [Rotaria sp. Silwood2]|nr:unnamed protein product [Rotaria sp. Silwood2]CAF3424152.1 unnamed protein product [Rotaria sp. Silwood2]CAF4265133.1 unnamed protein product [Rotaria sp. Silwood2]CAF4499150.1 unnamed protein product [Rotaria sp. Silwood2]